MCGPPGSGKSTHARKLEQEGFVYVNQDSQGKGYVTIFESAITARKDIVVDRLNFVKDQRSKFLNPAKELGYDTQIIVLHESYETCFHRCMARKDHETIKDETNARSALNMFFSKYERVSDDEADVVKRVWPEGTKPNVIVVDLDGTLCNIDERLHHVKGAKKNWKAFFDGIAQDVANMWCVNIIRSMENFGVTTVLCSGRPDNYRIQTYAWLMKQDLYNYRLLMRNRSDHRQDWIAKELILDFEILTAYNPLFFIDDREQVCQMWRRRGFVCLQCADGKF